MRKEHLRRWIEILEVIKIRSPSRRGLEADLLSGRAIKGRNVVASSWAHRGDTIVCGNPWLVIPSGGRCGVS